MIPLPAVAESTLPGFLRQTSRHRTRATRSARLRHRNVRAYNTPKNPTTPAAGPKCEPPDPPTTSSKSIPGPIWLWMEPLNSYSRMHSRRPYTVQFISSIIIYLIGDFTAQSIAPTPREAPLDPTDKASSSYDPQRTVRALIIGGTAAIPGYHWFLFLARSFNYASKSFSIVVKVLVNQVVFTPIFNTYFFGLQSLLAGATWTDVVARVKHTVPRSWKNSWKLWPAVTAFSFTFVRVELRGLFAGVIAIGWQTYLSVLNQRAAKLESTSKEEVKNNRAISTQTGAGMDS